MARYRREFAELAGEFGPIQPGTVRPRVMGLGAPAEDWSRIFFGRGDESRDNTLAVIGGRDAVAGFQALGRHQDAERVLVIDPDVPILIGGDARAFVQDGRWRGLKAVREHRVYSRNPMFCGYIHDLDNLPASTRWQADILHPERLAPRVRERLRTHSGPPGR